jgi:hypothetical protein
MLHARGGIEAANTPYVLWAQAQVVYFRVDFLLLDRRKVERPVWNVVECDGHDYTSAPRNRLPATEVATGT